MEPSLKNKYVACAAAILAIVAIVMTIWATMWAMSRTQLQKEQSVSPDLCRSVSCLEYGALYNASIDPTMNPCENFYAFVCGRWKNSLSVQMTARKDFYQAVSSVLMKTWAPKVRQNATQMAAKMFKSCHMKSDYDGEVEIIRNSMRQAGLMWPYVSSRPDVPYSLMYTSRHFMTPLLLSFSTDVSGHNPSFQVAASWDADRAWDPLKWWPPSRRETKKYRDFYDDLTKRFADNGSNTVPFEEICKIEAVLGKELDRVPDWSQYDSNPGFNKFQRFRSYSHAVDTKKWSKIANDMFLSDLEGLQYQTHYLTVNAVMSLLAIMNKTSQQAFHTYIGWYMVQVFPSSLIRSLLMKYVDDPEDTWQIKDLYCLQRLELFLGICLVAPFIEITETAEKRGEITNMVSGIRDSARRIAPQKLSFAIVERNFTGLFWIRDSYKSISTLNALFENYPDMGPSLPENWMRIMKVRNKTHATDYKMLFKDYFSGKEYLYKLLSEGPPWDVLRWNDLYLTIKPHHFSMPIYGYNATSSLLYGSLGSMVATAFANANNVTAAVAWKELSPGLNCTTESEAFKDFKAHPKDVISRFGMQEFLWEAFQHRTDRKKLANFTGYTVDQVFFIAQCYLLCGTGSTTEAQCNEPLKRSTHFSNTFKCSKGSPMNPADKCAVSSKP
ncbi:uncharacterized protein LOC135395147 [Ornithodoros turicata]|uniref:uncharacterized protein LOC135395147 n=1 Tax=Ornithodoros turicata TaxID=34597 RepID=UPI0031386B4C